jgi:hypothetical protein
MWNSQSHTIVTNKRLETDSHRLLKAADEAFLLSHECTLIDTKNTG